MIRDFQGNVIQLDKRGKEYPVDVLLTEQAEKLILVRSLNPLFQLKLNPMKQMNVRFANRAFRL